MTNFPGALDSLTNPSGTSLVTSPDHAAQHANVNDAMEAVEAKLGVGASTPTLNRILKGAGNGTSTWGTTLDNFTFGTPTITGGTINNAVMGTPTVTGGTFNTPTIGTPTITGGLNNMTIGTPAITGGTATSMVINGATIGTPAITGGTANSITLGTPTILGAFQGTQINPTDSQTTSGTTFVDMASGTAVIILTKASHVFAIGKANASNNTNGNYSYIQIAYDSGGSDTTVGQEGHSPSGVAGEEFSLTAGGLVSSLAAGTYNFTIMKKVNGGTSTFFQPGLSILVVPA